MNAVAPALYPGLLGAAWEGLDAAVRRAHLDGGALEVRGRFRVWCASGWVARFLCRAMRLPPAGEEVETQLVVTGDGGRERWVRSFGGHTLVTEERAGGGGELVECLRPIELRFRLRVEAGALCFEQIGAALRLGGLRLPLPRALAPRVVAREASAEGGHRVRVTVDVWAPVVGRLFAYEGLVAQEEEGR